MTTEGLFICDVEPQLLGNDPVGPQVTPEGVKLGELSAREELRGPEMEVPACQLTSLVAVPLAWVVPAV